VPVHRRVAPRGWAYSASAQQLGYSVDDTRAPPVGPLEMRRRNMGKPRLVSWSAGFGATARCTPRVELDVPVALNTIHTTGLQVVPDPGGGTVLDVGHPALTPLLPYLPAIGTWVWARDAPGVSEARRSARPAGTIVLDCRNRPHASWCKSPADLVVVPADQIDPAAGESACPAALLDLTALPQWRISYRLLAKPADVAGFHLDLTGVPPSAIEGPMHTLGLALRSWQLAGRTDRPLLLLRGARTVLARHAVATLLRVCRAGTLPVPVVRVDVSSTVLAVAVHTVVRVLQAHTGEGDTLLQVDGFPPCTAAPLQVLRSRGVRATLTKVTLRHHGRQVCARIHGSPARTGNELAAPGCTQTGQHLVVHGFPSASPPTSAGGNTSRAATRHRLHDTARTRTAHTPVITDRPA
jgi:hypothetical protein